MKKSSKQEWWYLVEIAVPFGNSTKNFHKYELKDGKYIISVYLPIKDFPDKPDRITVVV